MEWWAPLAGAGGPAPATTGTNTRRSWADRGAPRRRGPVTGFGTSFGGETLIATDVDAYAWRCRSICFSGARMGQRG